MAEELPPSYDSVVLSVAAGESSTDPDEVARIHGHGRNQTGVYSTHSTAYNNRNTETPSQHRVTSPSQIDTRYGVQHGHSNQRGYGHSEWPGMGETQVPPQSHSKSTEGFHPYYSSTHEQFTFDTPHRGTITDTAISRPRWDETPTSRDDILLAAQRGIRFEPVDFDPSPATNEVGRPETCFNKYVPYFVGLAFFLNVIFGGLAVGLLVYKAVKLDGKPGKEKWVQIYEYVIVALSILACCSPIILIGYFMGW